MAAPNNFQTGVDLLVTLAAQTYGGRESVTINMSADLLDVTDSGDNNWRNVKQGVRSWNTSLSGTFVEGVTTLTGCPTLKVAADGGTLTALSGIKSVTLGAQTNLIEVNNCSTANDKKYLAGRRDLTVNVEYDFLDTGGTGQNQAQHLAVLAAYEGGTILDFKLEPSATCYFQGEGIVTEIGISAENEGVITVSATIAVNGAITRSGTLDAGIEELLDAIFDTTQTTKAVVLQNTSATGSVKWTGNAWVSDISLTFAKGEKSKLNGTLTGDGALTRSTVA